MNAHPEHSVLLARCGEACIALLMLSLQLWSFTQVVHAQGGAIPCECRANGKVWQLGEQTCVSGSIRICGMNANVTTWIDTARSCATS